MKRKKGMMQLCNARARAKGTARAPYAPLRAIAAARSSEGIEETVQQLDLL
ncbi:hypothetical protein [Leucobacter aridicollis]|uniref:Uncharacterized protein n=1 Tax=Leucobacter aridicollis TaxID=283878 RepID=A0A852R879_9MICO|nr:hypothetical protein [Leucobacter aridicollis]NYD25486.1 hypothetical protein [Leucobacter aridicollis]